MAVSMTKIRAALIDLSGTLHIDNTPIKGAAEALKRLRSSKVGVRFVTNTTKESKRLLHERLASLGFDIDRSEIFTSLTAARQVVDKRGLRPMLFLEETALEDYRGISTDNPNAVVVGLSPTGFNYEALNRAFRLVLDGAPLIAVHKSRYYQRKDGPALGPGPFVAGLEYATDRKAEVVGKPEAGFFLQAISELDVSPQETVMIGDDVRDDVGGAQRCGMTGILVRTGKFRPGDEAKIDPPPNHVFDDFPAAVEYVVSSLI